MFPARLEALIKKVITTNVTGHITDSLYPAKRRSSVALQLGQRLETEWS